MLSFWPFQGGTPHRRAAGETDNSAPGWSRSKAVPDVAQRVTEQIETLFENRFTTEGLTIIALALVPIVLLGLGELRWRRLLKMAFDEQPHHARGQHRFRSSTTIGLGVSKLYVVLRPRAPINVKSLDIRFVGRDFFQWRDAWSPQIGLLCRYPSVERAGTGLKQRDYGSAPVGRIYCVSPPAEAMDSGRSPLRRIKGRSGSSVGGPSGASAVAARDGAILEGAWRHWQKQRRIAPPWRRSLC